MAWPPIRNVRCTPALCLAVRLAPRPCAAKALWHDVRNVARLAADRLGWEYDSWIHVGVGETLQKISCATLGDPCPPVHNKIFLESQRVRTVAEHGERHAWLALHVLDFLPDTHMGADELIVLDADPDH